MTCSPANRAVGRIALSVARRMPAASRAAAGHEARFAAGPLSQRRPRRRARGRDRQHRRRHGRRRPLRPSTSRSARAPPLTVTTAAAEKVYRSLGPDTAIDVKLRRSAPAARSAWLPQETILFDRARLARTHRVELAPRREPAMAEAVVFGRSAMGETVDVRRVASTAGACGATARSFSPRPSRLDGAIAPRLAEPAVADGGVRYRQRAVKFRATRPASRRFGRARQFCRRGRRIRLEWDSRSRVSSPTMARHCAAISSAC